MNVNLYLKFRIGYSYDYPSLRRTLKRIIDNTYHTSRYYIHTADKSFLP